MLALLLLLLSGLLLSGFSFQVEFLRERFCEQKKKNIYIYGQILLYYTCVELIIIILPVSRGLRRRQFELSANRIVGQMSLSSGYDGMVRVKSTHIFIYGRGDGEAPSGVSSYAKRIYAFIIRFIMRICPENVYIYYNIHRAYKSRLSGGFYFFLFLFFHSRDVPINPYNII